LSQTLSTDLTVNELPIVKDAAKSADSESLSPNNPILVTND